MAKLVTTKEKYGVSVAARIDPGMAHRISERAERLGVSMAKMVSLLIARGFNPQKPVAIENREEIGRLETEVADLEEETDALKTRLAEYEEIILAPLFNKHAGRTLSLPNTDGSISEKRIEDPIDILEVLLASVKQ
ncbi:MAG: hypothetical protein JKX84_09025 [Flavobacteriales bacterium]|nr:hypothetical protein [Flavobacteriales bacterium]